MKELAITIILFFLITGSLQAGLPNCVIYKAKFHLKDGRIITGSFEMSGYEDYADLDEDGSNSYCNNKGIILLIRIYQRQYRGLPGGVGFQEEKDFCKIPIYKTLYYLHPQQIRSGHDTYGTDLFGFLTETDIVYIDSNEIKKAVFIEAEYTKRAVWTSGIVVGTIGMIDTVMNQQYWNSLVVNRTDKDSLSFDKSNSFPNYMLFSYNPANNLEELKRLAWLKLSPRLEKQWDLEFRRGHGLNKHEELPSAL